MQENQNFEKYGCQNTVAIGISKYLDKDMSYQIAAR